MQEISNKQHLLAEDTLGNELIPSLCNLHIAHYIDCHILSVFSAKEKNLLAYKVTNPISNLDDVEPWMHAKFNTVVHISFSNEYQITPASFCENKFNTQKTSNTVIIDFSNTYRQAAIHYLNVLIEYHLSQKLFNQIYIYRTANDYTILLMNGDQCLLANTYTCDNEHEVLYFLLNALQISDILPSDTSLKMDYSIGMDIELIKFLIPHFAHSEILKYPSHVLNPEIPALSEKLFACYAASLCV